MKEEKKMNIEIKETIKTLINNREHDEHYKNKCKRIKNSIYNTQHCENKFKSISMQILLVYSMFV